MADEATLEVFQQYLAARHAYDQFRIRLIRGMDGPEPQPLAADERAELERLRDAAEAARQAAVEALQRPLPAPEG